MSSVEPESTTTRSSVRSRTARMVAAMRSPSLRAMMKTERGSAGRFVGMAAFLGMVSGGRKTLVRGGHARGLDQMEHASKGADPRADWPSSLYFMYILSIYL
ncbi:hypothetical protein CHELA41_22609 [Hyphomicrobiales bacterium]|nr:hypothetical protein CHELA41_22609 [Hyphomicrobiales bacterium]